MQNMAMAYPVQSVIQGSDARWQLKRDLRLTAVVRVIACARGYGRWPFRGGVETGGQAWPVPSFAR